MSDAGRGFELAIERSIAAPPTVVWRAWTERTADWWAPRPWTTRIIEMDLRPGGRSAMIMSGPDGDTPPMEAVFLEVIPEKSIIFTDALRVGWIPQTAFMVGFFSFSPDGEGTLYRAGARHWDESAMKQHEDMGFGGGWTTVAGQLADIAEAMG